MTNNDYVNAGAATAGVVGTGMVANALVNNGKVAANEKLHAAYVEKLKQTPIKKLDDALARHGAEIDNAAKTIGKYL